MDVIDKLRASKIILIVCEKTTVSRLGIVLECSIYVSKFYRQSNSVRCTVVHRFSSRNFPFVNGKIFLRLKSSAWLRRWILESDRGILRPYFKKARVNEI